MRMLLFLPPPAAPPCLTFLRCIAFGSMLCGVFLVVLFSDDNDALDVNKSSKLGHDNAHVFGYNGKKFYTHLVPAMTTDLLCDEDNITLLSEGTLHYIESEKLNEDIAKLWLHCGFERHDSQTANLSEFNAFIAPTYFYMSSSMEQVRNTSSHAERLTCFISELGQNIDSIVRTLMEHGNYTTNETMEEWMASHGLPHILLSSATNAPHASTVGIPEVVQF